MTEPYSAVAHDGVVARARVYGSVDHSSILMQFMNLSFFSYNIITLKVRSGEFREHNEVRYVLIAARLFLVTLPAWVNFEFSIKSRIFPKKKKLPGGGHIIGIWYTLGGLGVYPSLVGTDSKFRLIYSESAALWALSCWC